MKHAARCSRLPLTGPSCLIYVRVEEAMCRFPHALWSFWGAAFSKSRFGFSSSVKFGSTSAAFAVDATEGWAPCLQPWTNQCQLVWQEMGRINQFNSPRSLGFADRLSDLSFYGTESLQNQPLCLRNTSYLWLESLFQITFSCFTAWTFFSI